MCPDKLTKMLIYNLKYNKKYDMKEKSSVQAHISMMQSIINRMAANSANCKLWCITIMAAILALYFDGKTTHIEYGYFIVGLFYFLDCFYLGLERQFVKAQNDFVEKLNAGASETDIMKQIFIPFRLQKSEHECWIIEKIHHFGKQLLVTMIAMFSFSTTPFYGAILFALYWLQNN